MFHMVSCFSLAPGFEIEAFRTALRTFADHLTEKDLLERVGPIGKRQPDTILDTDDERHQTHFVIMSFRDREQSDAAVQYIQENNATGRTLHDSVYGNVLDPIFICWQDC